MEETRVSKYKEYRDSMIKENSIPLDTPKKSNSSKSTIDINEHARTSTIPLDQVMDSLNEDEKQEAFLKKRRLKKTLKIALIVGIVAVVAAVLIIFGVIVFRR